MYKLLKFCWRIWTHITVKHIIFTIPKDWYEKQKLILKYLCAFELVTTNKKFSLERKDYLWENETSKPGKRISPKPTIS